MATYRIFAALLTACLLAAPPPPWFRWSSGDEKNVGVVCMAEGSVLPSTLLSNQRSMLGTETQIFSGVSEVPAWRGRLDTVHGRSYFSPSIYLNACNRSKQNCSALPGESYPYERYEIDPTGSGRPVMRVSFPAGHWSPGSQKPGGTLFYAYPYKTSPTSTANPFSRQTAYFEYEVYFPPDFEFVKGGKLPGFAGGDKQGRGCGGGVDPNECFSYRVMWRKDGGGEAYVYAPEGEQGENFCEPPCMGSKVQPCTLCNYGAGVSLKRFSFFFQKGTWTKLRLGMTLNTLTEDDGNNDGTLTLEVNGTKLIEYNQMKWRKLPGIYIEGIAISTWFGGGSSDWAPTKDQHLLFRNFRAFYEGPKTPIDQLSKLSAPLGDQKGQIIEEGYIDEAE